MLRTLKRLFKSKSSPLQGSPAAVSVGARVALQCDTPSAPAPDRPRFPPSYKEHPVIDPATLLADQRELITPLKDVLGLSPEDFARYVEPVLLRYAEYVQLLPASHVHHHRGAGGLLRHGLEVAYHTGIQARGVTFRFDGPLREKHEHKTQWRLVYTLAGLLHDVGKPISDMRVVSASGNAVWEPFRTSLWQWSQEHSVERYVVHWLVGRQHRQHEKLGFIVANKVIGDEVFAYISRIDRIILPTLMSVLGGQAKPDELLQKAVVMADRHSVSTDLKLNRIEVDGTAQHVSVDQRLLEIMRELTRIGQWKTHGTDATVWIIDASGCAYIDWEVAVGDIVRMANSLSMTGMPRDPHALADILLERGIAMPGTRTVDGGTQDERYHLLKVNDQEVLALKISDARYIFTYTVPLPPQSATALETPTTGQDHESAPAIPPASDVTVQAATTTDAQALLDVVSAQLVQEGNEDAKPPTKPIVTIPAIDDLIVQLVAEEGNPPPLSDADYAHEPHAVESDKSQQIDDVAMQNPAATDSTPIDASPVEPAPSKREVLAATLNALGEDAHSLAAIINCVLNGKEPLGPRLVVIGASKVGLRYPAAVQGGDKPVLSVVRQLGNTGALVADPVMPGKYVLQHKGESMLLLSKTLSAQVKAALDESAQQADPFAQTERAIASSAAVCVVGDTSQRESPSQPVASVHHAPPKERPLPSHSMTPKPSTVSPSIPHQRDATPVTPEIRDARLPPAKAHVDLEKAGMWTRALTAPEAIEGLKQMMCEGHGPWLTGPVLREGNTISVDYESTSKQIIAHHPYISRNKLRLAFAATPVRGITVKAGRIMVMLPKGEGL